MLWPTHSAYINPVQHQWEIWSDLVDSNIHHHHQNTKFGESLEESKPRSIKAFLTTNEDTLCVPPPPHYSVLACLQDRNKASSLM